jgi:hypothetical protein
MNALTYAAPTDVIHDVLQAVAPAAASGEPSTGALGGAIRDTFESAVREAWVRFQAMVERCTRDGYEAVCAEITSFTGHIEMVAGELGARAEEFRQRVLEKIRETIIATFDALLSCMRSTVLLGGRTYLLDSIDLEHKLVYSGSLEMSLTALCKFVGGGELVVKGSYKIADAGSGT